MPSLLPLALPGTLGNDVGAGADGVLIGALTPTAPATVLLSSFALAARFFLDDGGLYVDDTTDFGDADTGDVALLPATPAVDDAVYVGHASSKFGRVDFNISTAGSGTWTFAFEYWNGTAWTALAGVSDGTTAFTAGTGVRSLTFTVPTDWAKNTVDSVLCYWIRIVVATYSAVTTQPLATNGNIVATAGQEGFTDETADANSAGASDVELLPANPAVGDSLYVGYSVKFCAVKATWSQARTGTATITPEYWNGSAWTALATVDDDTVGWSATAGTKLIHFVPPSDWAANTTGNGPNGTAGYFIRMRLSALTSMTQQPLGTQLWVLPLTTGANGIIFNFATTLTRILANAITASASNTDSVFLLVNKTTGNFVSFTWTKATARVTATVSLAFSINDELVVKQVTEDGTTEFANGQLMLSV